jgi:hypothetical protein
MSDTFTFVAPVMPRRRLGPFAGRLIALILVLAIVLAGFAAFVVRAERAADAHRLVLQAEQDARQRVDAQRLAAQAEGGLARQQEESSSVPAGVARLLDEQARDAASRTLALAQGALAQTGRLASADVTDLTQREGGLLFVDGPSSAPTIVSVAATASSWGAAVMGPSGTCYQVSLRAGGQVGYDHGAVCTGQAALAASAASW